MNEYYPSLQYLRFSDKCSNGHCSQEIKNIIPDPVRRVRTTRGSTYSHPFQVTLPNPRTLSYKSSFIPRTSQLWNSLPPTTFPESYNFSSFKSNINKLDLVSLLYLNFPIFSVFPLSRLCYRPYGLSPTLVTKEKTSEAGLPFGQYRLLRYSLVLPTNLSWRNFESMMTSFLWYPACLTYKALMPSLVVEP